jgi:hypothetical protein
MRQQMFLPRLAFVALLVLCAPPAFATGGDIILHSFVAYPYGSNPFGGVVRDSAGNLYGVTAGGGTYANGTVFELQPNSHGGWTKNVLYSFKGGVDGSVPNSVIFDSAGNLCGTTFYGGQYSKGAIFELSPSGGGSRTETVAYSFAGGSDGQNPNPGLVVDSSGNVYGTTYEGGSACTYSTGCGTAFKLSAGTGHNRTETVLHAFTDTGSGDGGYPSSGLIFDSSGNLYGTTSSPCILGFAGFGTETWCGTVYELSPAGGGTWSETVLRQFKPTGNDGSSPYGGLVMGLDGGLYGTTTAGGSAYQGVVFEVVP